VAGAFPLLMGKLIDLAWLLFAGLVTDKQRPPDHFDLAAFVFLKVDSERKIRSVGRDAGALRRQLVCYNAARLLHKSQLQWRER
jgi:hypothetical protein